MKSYVERTPWLRRSVRVLGTFLALLFGMQWLLEAIKTYTPWLSGHHFDIVAAIVGFAIIDLALAGAYAWALSSELAEWGGLDIDLDGDDFWVSLVRKVKITLLLGALCLACLGALLLVAAIGPTAKHMAGFALVLTDIILLLLVFVGAVGTPTAGFVFAMYLLITIASLPALGLRRALRMTNDEATFFSAGIMLAIATPFFPGLVSWATVIGNSKWVGYAALSLMLTVLMEKLRAWATEQQKSELASLTSEPRKNT